MNAHSAVSRVTSEPKIRSLVREEGDSQYLVRREWRRSFEELRPIANQWDECVACANAPVYMSFDWLETWWKFYGRAQVLRLYLVWQGEKLIGGVPWYVQQVGPLGLGVRVAQLVGANLPPKCFEPALGTSAEQQCIVQMVHDLQQQDKCDLLCMGPVSELWSGSSLWLETVEALGSKGWRSRYTRNDVRTVFQLPDRFEAFLAELSPAERKSRLKRLRQLERSCHLEVDVVSAPDTVAGEFDRFVELHSQQWRTQGRGGHFVAWPRGLEFHRELVRRMAAQKKVRFYRMLGDAQVLASRYTYLFGQTLFSELAARVVGDPWDRRGVGACSLLKFIEQAIGEGVRRVDSGLGHYEHKAGMGGREVEAGRWYLWPSSPSTSMRVTFWLAVARAGLSVYRKVWYRRLVPLLPESWSRTQSAAIVRYDL